VTPWLVGRASFVWKPTFGRAEWKALLRLALPLAVSATIGVLYFRLLVLLCSLVSTAYETGLLATSYRIVELLYGLGAVGASVALPVLAASAHEPDRLRYMTQRMSEVALLAACYLSILVFSVAAPVLVLLGGADYEAAAPVLRIQVFAFIPVFLAQVWLTALVAIGRLTALATAGTVGLVLAGGLGVVLIEAEGAEGGAIAALVGEAALAAVLFVLLTASRPAHRLRLTVAWKAACASVALVAVVQLLDVSPWFDVAIGTAAFTGVALLTRAIPSELRDAFAQARRRVRSAS
jgi:O-antigen/teichoic acid export membrane protein